MSNLPEGWRIRKFAEVFDFKGGSQPPKTEFVSQPRDGYVRLLQIRDFESDAKAVYIKDSPKWPKCSQEDIMIGRYGASVGKVLWGKSGAYNVALVRLIFDKSKVSAQWARFLCTSEYFQAPLRNISRSAQNGFNKEDLAEIEFPFPPYGDQCRVATKLSNLLARSKKAREELARIPRLVQRYKQAILSAAFSGELTADRRSSAARKPKGCLATELANIRSEYFRQSNIQMKAALSPSWMPEIDLPAGWELVSVDQLTTLVQYGSSAKTSESEKNAIPVLRMGNIIDGQLDYTNLKYLPSSHEEFPELLLEHGDILFNRTNSADLVGKTAVYADTGRPTSFASYLIRLRVVGYLPELLSAYINSSFGRQWVRSVVNQQVGQANVNGTKLRELGVPLMPMEEQKELCLRIKAACGRVDRLAGETGRAASLLERLDQATLTKAFQGELVKE